MAKATQTSKVLDKKFFGEEPTLPTKHTQSELIKVYSWYNYMMDADDAASFALKEFGSNPDFARVIKSINPNYLTTIGWNCRIIEKNPELRDEFYQKAFVQLSNLRLRNAEMFEPKEKEPTAPEESVVRRKREERFLGDFEEQYDKLIFDSKPSPWDMYGWLQTNSVPQYIASKINDQLENQLEELEAVIDKSDPQIVEGYSNQKKSEIKRKIALIEVLLSHIERYSDNKKKERKPRKKKVKSTEQVLSKFQYQEKSDQFKLQSINPALIIGATQLWVFNTRYRKLGVYYSLDGGFSVKGTTIQNFDEKRSIEKILRKPEEGLKLALEYTKPQLKNLMKEFKTAEIALTGRTGQDTILLRVFK